MGVLTDMAGAAVKAGVTSLYGTIATKPDLLVSDGIQLDYACDVNVGPTDPSGVYDQLINHLNGKAVYLVGLPGQPDSAFRAADVDTINTTLHNCTIDKNNEKLRWADVGSPVRVERTASGVWRVVEFSIQQPGTFTATPVNLGDLVISETIDLTVTQRVFNLGEFGTLKPFGALPLGATGVFLGTQLQRIVS